MSDTVELSFLGAQVEKALAELQKIRRELTDVRTLSLQGIDYSRRLERNMVEMKDDLELIIKAEIMGRLGNFEGKIEQRFDKIEELLTELKKQA